ncbi:hypothetical protein F1D05_33375 [Kribbella qitaiheensis]|uniref:Uncharacterized protein n=1 Tax=Kribbella qitaiheensis TaxID=1544730 RepID=A0A7G6X6P9_9ACTN|nr:hypothetical protein [Kribbella qitaiheensis]QNE21914.1 hypothetical protein F1D05_33375 [Kribbella qitaiheensis]
MRPRTFELVRYHDLSGVSGTGVVAEGCVFTDGSVALRWRGNNPATAVWPDLDSVLAVHGHQGATEVRWLEPDPPAELSRERRDEQLPTPDTDLDHLFGASHNVRPPTGVADPSGLPTQHPRGWAAARHLR